MFIPVAVIVSSLVCLACFDYLVWTEFHANTKAWIADGQPRGFFWSPSAVPVEAARKKRLLFANTRLSFYWIFHTPEWSRGIAGPYRALLVIRSLVAFNFLLLPIYVYWKLAS
jgi:hypothetical protein